MLQCIFTDICNGCDRAVQYLNSMLMKPPSIFDDVVSQDSENYTVRSNRPKPSQAKKETTLRMAAPAQPRENHSHERDGHSVHSNASSGSKKRDKRAKETTLGRPKVNEPREEDTHSVHSNGSRHSQKSAKKESNIMQRPKIQQHSLSRHEQPLPNKPLPINNQELSFKNAIGDPEESVIKRYDLMEDSPQPVRYQQPRVHEEERGRGKKFAPFMELEQRQASQEDIPIFRIEEPSPKIHNRVVGVARQEGRQQRHQKQQRKQRPQMKQVKMDRPQIKMDRPEALPIEQSQTIFDTSRLGNTKSVRRPIFAREQLANTSKVSNAIDQSNVSGLQGSSRRKSNSHLRQLFNNSRQKQMQNESKVQSSLGELASQSRALGGKPAVGGQMARVERKVVDDEQFGIESLKSNLEIAGLDLTVSNHTPLDRDSLIFEFQPEKRKGMTVTSKNKQPLRTEHGLASSEQELLAIGRELTSAQQPIVKEQGKKGQGMKETAEGLPVLRKEMESKELAHVDRLLKENEQFLRSSAILNLSDSDRLKRDSGDDYLFNLDDEQLPLPWQPKREEPLDIKRVQRNEKVAGKVQKNEIVKQTLPNEEGKRQQANKKQQERKTQPIKQQHPKQQQPVPIAIKQEQNIFDQAPITIKQEQTKQREIEKRYIKEESTKSPGKIARNFDDGDSRSEKSGRSGKKGKTVKESALPRTKTHKVDIRNEAPRAEESFYEQPKEEKEPSIDDLSLFSRDNPAKKTQQKYPWQQEEQKPVESKKANVYRFSDDQNEVTEKPKSRTDVNFYDHEARSNRPPSSRPPLSGKSNKSKSTSKDKVPKQTTLKISSNQPQQQVKPVGNAFKKGGKMTLMERAMQRHGESEEDSQGSFSSREDFSHDSRRSSQSRGSRKSIKENTISIDRKNTPLIHARPPQRKPSSNSSSQEGEREPYTQARLRQEGRLRQEARVHEENKLRPTGSQRAIVSRNCTFIDEKGRLVQQDLVMRGGEVFGMSRTEDSTVQALDRMRRTKESRRSRSRSRDSRQRVEGKGSSFEKGSSCQDSSYCSSFYDNSSWRQEARGGALREFLKPVEQVPLYAQQGRQEAPRTFNDKFGKKQQESHDPSNSNISDSRSRRSLKRTENSARKR